MVNYPFKLYCATCFRILKKYHVYQVPKSIIIFICSSCTLISSLLISILFALHVQFFERQNQHVVSSSIASRGWIWCPSHVKNLSIQPCILLRRLLWWLGVLSYGSEPSCCFGLKEAFGHWGLPQSFYREEKIKNQPDDLHCITRKYYI